MNGRRTYLKGCEIYSLCMNYENFLVLRYKWFFHNDNTAGYIQVWSDAVSTCKGSQLSTHMTMCGLKTLTYNFSREKRTSISLKFHNVIWSNCIENWNEKCSAAQFEPLCTVWTKALIPSQVVRFNLWEPSNTLQYDHITIYVLWKLLRPIFLEKNWTPTFLKIHVVTLPYCILYYK